MSRPDLEQAIKEARGEPPSPSVQDDLALIKAEFAALRKQRTSLQGLDPMGPTQERTLIQWKNLGNISQDPTDLQPELITCWCKDADCEGRWPVMAVDADDRPERPYFCVATTDEQDEHGNVVVVPFAGVLERGFAEPN